MDYSLRLEEHNGYTFIHCDVHVPWTKTVKKKLQEELQNILQEVQPIYAIHEIGDNKHLKFLTMFGFEYLQNVVGVDLKERQVFYIG